MRQERKRAGLCSVALVFVISVLETWLRLCHRTYGRVKEHKNFTSCCAFPHFPFQSPSVSSAAMWARIHLRKDTLVIMLEPLTAVCDQISIMESWGDEWKHTHTHTHCPCHLTHNNRCRCLSAALLNWTCWDYPALGRYNKRQRRGKTNWWFLTLALQFYKGLSDSNVIAGGFPCDVSTLSWLNATAWTV